MNPFDGADEWFDSEADLHDTEQSSIRLVEILESESRCSELMTEIFGLAIFAGNCLDKEAAENCYVTMQVLSMARSAYRNDRPEFLKRMSLKEKRL